MTTLPNMNLVLPTQGSAGAGVWDDVQDANSALIDAHDHSTGKGVTVKTAGISINADLTFSSLYAPINLHRITFASIVALSSNNKSLFVSSSDNELYWRSNAGTNVKLTSGSALNVAAFTGGIGGDYASVGAAVAFDDAGDRYTFKQQAPGNWARLASGDVRLFETGTTDSVFVGLAAPAALASSFTITMPLAVPAGKTIMQMDASGVISAALAVPAATSYVTMSSAGVLATTPISTAWQHCILNAVLADATASLLLGTSGGGTTPRLALSTSGGEHVLPLTLPVGTITGFSVSLNKASAAGTITAKLFEGQSAAGVGSHAQIGSTQSNAANNPGNITLSQTGLSTAMTAGRQYYIYLTGGGTTGDAAFSYSATVTPP